MVLAVGGNHLTQDIAHGLRLPMTQAEEVKKIFFGKGIPKNATISLQISAQFK
jgi:cell division protein FtsA